MEREGIKRLVCVTSSTMSTTSPVRTSTVSFQTSRWTIDGEKQDKSLFAMIKNTHELHPEGTIVAYNGSGPAAQRYGDDVLARARLLPLFRSRLQPVRPKGRPLTDSTVTRPGPEKRT